ncbi:MAG: DUF433 domain-containing protein [Acidobacteria bacterium]|nr:DUF433 domain-containing protein [Acidobacteriota bacterium]
MDWRNRIVADPDILVGKPVIKGTRISVCLACAKEVVQSERVYTLKR